MSNQRVTPHRVKRETAKSREQNELRKENLQLRRTVQRLEKEVHRREQAASKHVEDGLEEDGTKLHKKTKTSNVCPMCGSEDIRTFTLCDNTYTACKDCGWRKKVTNV
jgi:predicted RNA-binding Zn-ribbon protein involved in translation (DUF1610 family)